MKENEIPIDPELPEAFDSTPNTDRPDSHQEWWFRPYIGTHDRGCTVYCLDGGSWDGPTCKGQHATLEEALGAARNLAEDYAQYRAMQASLAVSMLWYPQGTFVDPDKDEWRDT
jgi:hypothetical protein